MLRNSSTQALARRTSQGLSVRVRRVPTTAPTTIATSQAQPATASVQRQASNIHSRYVRPLPSSCRKTCQSHVMAFAPCFFDSPKKNPDQVAPAGSLLTLARRRSLLGVLFGGLVVQIGPSLL